MVLAILAPVSGAARSAPTDGEVPAVRSGTARRVGVGPTIDGRLDEGVWALGQPMSGFVQYEPLEGSPASEEPEVRILFDGDAIYIGAWLYDRNPDRIILGERRRDANLQNSDAFLVVLDTYHDQQTGFVFGTTPGSVEYDGQVRGEGNANTSWGGSWTVASSQDGEDWYTADADPLFDPPARLRSGAGVGAEPDTVHPA